MSGTQFIKAIILASRRDFGRCPLTSQLPTSLWPVGDKPVLERLLVSLANQGIKQATICSNEESMLAESIQIDNRLELNLINETLPLGTAGCIRDAIDDEENDSLYLVFPSSIVNPPNINSLINAHRSGKSDLTMMFNPDGENDKLFGEPAEIYICKANIKEYIPQAGFFDIKEGLIPKMLRAGKTIHAASLPDHTGNFRDRQEYLCAIVNYMETHPKLDLNLKAYKGSDSQAVCVANNIDIDPTARIYGPVVIMDDVHVSNNTVILGPTVLGNNVSISKNSIIANSVLWDGVKVESNCQIRKCIIDYNTTLRANTNVEDKSLLFKQEGILEYSSDKLHRAFQPLLQKINKSMPDWIQSNKQKILPWFAAGIVFAAFLWSYWPSLMDLWKVWQRSDEYSSGLLVPFLAAYILYSRRHDITKCMIKSSIWGLFAFLGAQAVRLFGLYFMYSSAERLSIVLTIVALVLLLFGWQIFRKTATVLLFLCLMLPWPSRVQTAITLPLQRWSTSSAVFCLEIVGYEVVQEGNIIQIGNASVAVAEACNGLRMITAFIIISGLIVLLVKRAWWEKLIILISSLPIALLCNTIRLAITAIFFTILEGEHWEKIFHDFGGYAMMPLALAATVAELWLLAKLTIPPEDEEKIIITRQPSVKS